MIDRPTSDHERTRLKNATGRAIKRAGGGASFATQTRVEAPVLSKYAAPHEDHFVPVDVAVDCDRAAGAPVILSAYASVLGYAITPLDSTDAGGLTPNMIGSLIRETGDVSATILEAMADGKITPNERKAITAEIDEATQALFELRKAVNGAD